MTLLGRQEGLVGQVGGAGSWRGLRAVVFVLSGGARARGRSANLGQW